ncbi:hypothetical protein KCM76_05430 [Zooshikella marina]|uniref:hypothetical protein n=1 Tax=Zooshikella ganghwensis TaxID=202772 RepID=UPI001BAF78E0|nr:hypothetical protein [Zooshikella ganghwensis]MBU2705409.1 hypothetical protein [Zooshikella ganghwensis]
MNKKIKFTLKSLALGLLIAGSSANAQTDTFSSNVLSVDDIAAAANSFSISNLATAAEFSSITDLKVLAANTVSFDYNLPNDGEPGKVLIWYEAMDVDLTRKPDFSMNLPNHKGNDFVLTDRGINFQQGIYTIAITAGQADNTVAATKTMIVGQPAHTGRSTLFVSAKTKGRITAVYNSPANVVADQNITWFRLFEGEKLVGGNLMIQQTRPPSRSSGLVSMEFAPGTLIDGQTYTLVLNPGPTTQAVSASYTFQYTLQ